MAHKMILFPILDSSYFYNEPWFFSLKNGFINQDLDAE